MTFDDTKLIIATMVSAYPNYKPENIQFTIGTWAKFLEKYTSEQCSNALQDYIASDTSGFAPSIGAIIQRIEKKNGIKLPNEMEAWDMVSNIITSDWEFKKEDYYRLPNIVRKCIGINTLFDISNRQIDVKTVMPLFVQCYKRELGKATSDIEVAKSAMLIETSKENEPKEEDEIKGYEVAEDGIPIITDEMWENFARGK